MSSIYGKNLKVSIFGQSHSDSIGVTVDMFPAGYKLDYDFINEFMKRRAPGAELTTARREEDIPEFICGIKDGITCGAPITAIIKNNDVRSADYNALNDIPRPSHADYTARIKYGGYEDRRGGGHFSGRLTAPLCVAGALCIGILKNNGVTISSSLISVGGATGNIDSMMEEVKRAKADCDSVGGVIECTAAGLPAGLGDPIFDGMESRISSAVFGIPGVRGVEFGKGFAAAKMRGSEHNDTFIKDNDGNIVTETNNHGGIIGGITSGMPIVLRVAMKPTPSIAKEQKTLDLSSGDVTSLSINGRHDPCIALRALPCIESALAISVLDAWIESGKEIIR